jgi:hypothetical protein
VVVPVAFYPIEDAVGALHVFGQITAAGFQWHYAGADFGVGFLFCMFYPVVNLVNGIVSNPKDRPYFLDVVYFLVGIWGYCKRFVRLLDMFGVFYTLTSPLMILVPILLYGSLAEWLWSMHRDRAIPLQRDSEHLIESSMYKIEQ